MFLRTYTPSEDTDLPAYPRSLFSHRVPPGETLDLRLSKERTVKIQIRLHSVICVFTGRTFEKVQFLTLQRKIIVLSFFLQLPNGTERKTGILKNS